VRWGRALLVFGGLVFAAGGVVAAYPMWADSWAQGVVVERVEKLTGGTLTFEAFDLEYTAVRMKGAVLTLAEGTQVRLEKIDVKLDRDALWSGRAVVTSVDVDGGSAAATSPRTRSSRRTSRAGCVRRTAARGGSRSCRRGRRSAGSSST
jgi:hypothetical protein